MTNATARRLFQPDLQLLTQMLERAASAPSSRIFLIPPVQSCHAQRSSEKQQACETGSPTPSACPAGTGKA